MKINIVGNGSFGTFLSDLLADKAEITDTAESVILAVPIHALHDVGRIHEGKHLINVCSVQKPSNEILLKYSDRVTGVHPLFGRRTQEDKRFTIVTRPIPPGDHYTAEQQEILKLFLQISTKVTVMTDTEHDQLMGRTHVSAVLGARMLKDLVDGAEDVPDHLIPNSFRLMRNFVKTLEDTPVGTLESIMANPFIK